MNLYPHKQIKLKRNITWTSKYIISAILPLGQYFLQLPHCNIHMINLKREMSHK